MHRIIRWLSAALLIVGLAACGGGGGSAGECVLCGSSGGNTDTTSATVADLRIEFGSGSATSIANLAPVPVTVVVTAVNSLNQVVSGASVVVRADTGVVTAASTSTDNSGQMSSTVGMGANTAVRTITVTATSGSVSKSIAVPVVSSANGGSASLALALSSTSVTANSPVTVTATLADASGAPVSNAVVGFSAVSGLATFSSNSALTDSNGNASVVMYPATNATSGADSVQASAAIGGTALTATKGFQITATNVNIVSFSADTSGPLSAYGQVGLTAKLSGTSAGTPVTVTISSVCLNKGKATITPTTQTTTNGTATFTYKDQQCGATESADTVTLAVSGTTLQQTLPIALGSPSASSLGFVSSTPETIYLRESGFVERSDVVFVVNDEAGNPLPGQHVVMTPTTTVGDLSMDGLKGPAASVEKISDSNGQVTVRINAGTVPTPVRVKATLMVNGVAVASTVSSNLSIAVGLPSQLNFSLSQKTINIEGGNTDGTTNTYTVIASDRMGNPVPAGTTINFVSEGGQIQSQSRTAMTGGLASATASFQSASPRPADGRVTVLAYALGEESFLDANGDNAYGSLEAFQDLGDVFLSRRYNAEFNAANDDQYIKGDGSTACTSTSSILLRRNATIPSKATTCDAAWSRTGYVRRAAETVFSSSSSRLLWYSRTPGGGDLDGSCSRVSLVSSDDGVTSLHTNYLTLSGSSVYNLSSQGSLTFLVTDDNTMQAVDLAAYYPSLYPAISTLVGRRNPMPAGTTLSVSATDGIAVSVGGGSPVPNTSEATAAAIAYKFDTASSGTIFIRTTSPGGLVTAHAVNVYMRGAATPATTCSL